MRTMLFAVLTLVGFANYPAAQGIEEERVESEVHMMTLENGIKVYIQNHTDEPNHGVIRVIARRPSCDHIVYAFNGALDSLSTAEEFFADYLTSDSCSTFPQLPLESPQEMAVVAVGDFSVLDMLQIIQRRFGSIQLDSAQASNIQVTRDETAMKVALRMNFPHHTNDLNEKWKYFFVQDLFQNRLERCTRSQDEMWIHPHPRLMHPVSGYALVSEEIAENLLSYFLLQVESIRADGFTYEEFCVTKKNLLNNMQFLSSYSTSPCASFLAAYYADQFLIDSERCDNFCPFLTTAQQIIEALTFEELQESLASFFDEDKRMIHLIYPERTQRAILTVEKIESLCEDIASLSTFYNDMPLAEEAEWFIDTHSTMTHPQEALFVQNNQPVEFCLADNIVMESEPQRELFYHLPIHDSEKHLIAAIVMTIADKNVFQLAFEKRGLEKKGKKVNVVHPLRFIGHIFANPELKRAMRVIRKSSFKWDGFVDGYAKRMKLENEHNNLFKYVPGFAEYVKADPNEITHYIRRKDWEGLLIYLM